MFLKVQHFPRNVFKWTWQITINILDQSGGAAQVLKSVVVITLCSSNHGVSQLFSETYIVIDQECCTVRPFSGSPPPFHPSAALKLFLDWVWTEVLTMRLLVVSCAPLVSSFTLSLACLLSAAITVHDTRRTLSTAATAASPSMFLFLCLFLPHTVAHGDRRLWSGLCLYPPHLPTLLQVCWLPAPRVLPSPICDDEWILVEPDITLHWRCQMSHLINISLFFLSDSVPSKPTLRASCIRSPTCCDGTVVFRRYPGSFAQQRPVGLLCAPPRFPRPAPPGLQQRATLRAYWTRKKIRRRPSSLPSSAAPDPPWLNSK